MRLNCSKSVIAHSTALILQVVFFGLLTGLSLQAASSYSLKISLGLDEPWRWQTFDQTRSFDVKCVEEDGNGVFWIGGDKGIMSYDGFDWKTYGIDEGLAHLSLNDLEEVNGRRLYAACQGGLYHWKGSEDRWDKVLPNEDVPYFNVYRIHQGKSGGIWLATSLGLVKLIDEDWELWASESVIEALEANGIDWRFKQLPTEKLPLMDWGASTGIKILEMDFVAAAHETYPLLITEVAKGSDAEAKGIRAGDALVNVDGLTPYEPSKVLAGRAGDISRLRILHRGSE